MTRVIGDGAIEAQLKGSSESLEICGESGEVLGYFQPLPPVIHDREIDDRARAEFAKMEDEIEESRQGTAWFTTAEVLEQLRNL